MVFLVVAEIVADLVAVSFSPAEEVETGVITAVGVGVIIMVGARVGVGVGVAEVPDMGR